MTRAREHRRGLTVLLLLVAAGATSGCAGMASTSRLQTPKPTEVPRPTQTAGRALTFAPISSAELDAYCDDPSAAAAWAEAWNAEAAVRRAIADGDAEALAEAQDWVFKARAAAEVASENRPLPTGWAGSFARGLLDLQCLGRDSSTSTCVMPEPGEQVPDCMRRDE